MLKIWGRPNSVNVKKVLWCADELAMDYEHINAGGPFGVVDTPEYRAINPNGLVPCIQDGDHTLWESNTIVRYLCARPGTGDLYENDPAQRAQSEQWMDWVLSTLAAPFRDVLQNLIRKPPEQRDMDLVEKGIAACKRQLAIADAALADAPYLSGDRFGMGDIPAGCYFYGWLKLPIERPHYPNLQAWYERLETRPAYQKRVMLPLT